MKNETKIIIIGTGPTVQEMAVISKTLANNVGVTIAQTAEDWEKASQELNRVSGIAVNSIENFSKAIDNHNRSIKIKRNSEPKSKYFNRPQRNFKKR